MVRTLHFHCKEHRLQKGFVREFLECQELKIKSKTNRSLLLQPLHTSFVLSVHSTLNQAAPVSALAKDEVEVKAQDLCVFGVRVSHPEQIHEFLLFLEE